MSLECRGITSIFILPDHSHEYIRFLPKKSHLDSLYSSSINKEIKVRERWGGMSPEYCTLRECLLDIPRYLTVCQQHEFLNHTVRLFQFLSFNSNWVVGFTVNVESNLREGGESW